MVNTEIRLITSFAAEDGEALYSQQKQDLELTVTQIMNSLLQNSESRETTRQFRYDLNQIPYDYTVEMINRFKRLDLVDRVPEELWMEVCNTAKSLQSCPTLCDPVDGSPPGSPIPGTLQARTLEWVAISFSNAWKWKVKVKSLSRVRLFVTPWTAAYQAPPSMGF